MVIFAIILRDAETRQGETIKDDQARSRDREASMEERFSDRMGITTPPALQLDGMTTALRASLWNVLDAMLGRPINERWIEAAHVFAVEYFKERADVLPRYHSEARNWVATRYFKLPWYEVYNFVEFIRPRVVAIAYTGPDDFVREINSVLQREVSGYRFFSGRIAPISNEAEMASIQDALNAARSHGLVGVDAHLFKSVSLLSQKPNPDYHNSIKEGITAVEGVANLLSGDMSSGLDKPLNELAQRVPIHPAMKEPFVKLYGYTSSREGIRHPMLEPSTVGFDEAKFMLVACSAFVYFLISKASAAGMLKSPL
jgi:hypothetical protein